jgi:hypothetical protein
MHLPRTAITALLLRNLEENTHTILVAELGDRWSLFENRRTY